MKRFINSLKDASRLAVCTGCLVGLLSAVAPTPPAWGVPITVTFRDAVEAGGTTTSLPFYLSGDIRNVFLRFNVPDFNQIVSINSVEVTVRVSDDIDNPPRSETGEILFSVRSPYTDFTFGNVASSELDGKTQTNPFVFTYSLSTEEIALAYPTITDNDAFRIRVQRTGGDFYVLDGEVSIDANLGQVPEPATMLLFGLGLMGIAGIRRKFKK